MIKEYEFYISPNQRGLISKGDGAVEAFNNLKRDDQDNFFRLAKYTVPAQLPPEHYSLLSIGNGLAVAYKIVA